MALQYKVKDLATLAQGAASARDEFKNSEEALDRANTARRGGEEPEQEVGGRGEGREEGQQRRRDGAAQQERRRGQVERGCGGVLNRGCGVNPQYNEMFGRGCRNIL